MAYYVIVFLVLVGIFVISYPKKKIKKQKEIFNKIQPKIIQEKNLQMNYSISILEILIMSKVHLNVLRLKIVLLN